MGIKDRLARGLLSCEPARRCTPSSYGGTSGTAPHLPNEHSRVRGRVMREDWDAVVIGSGVGGLCSAAYLSTNGRRVLVLEAQPVIGGASQTFRRKRVFEFATGAHYIGDCVPGGVIPTVLKGVGLEHEVHFHRMDDDEFDRIVGPDFDFRVPRGWDRFEEHVVSCFPAEERGVRATVRSLRRMAEAMEALGAPPIPRVRDVIRNVRVLPALRDGAKSLESLFDENGLSEPARVAIGYISMFVLLPREKLARAIYAYGLHHYVKSGGFGVDGGVGKIPHTLARVIRSHGGEVRLRTAAETVLVEQGKAVGVRLASGDEVYAPVVVSNADIATTYNTLVPPGHLSARRRRRFQNAALSGCGFSTYIGVDIDIREYMPAQNTFTVGTLDYSKVLRTMFESGPDEFDPENILVWITSGSLKSDPEPGRAGYSSLELTTLTPQSYAFWGLHGGPIDGVDYHRHPAYVKQKQQIEEALIRKTLEVMPFLDGHIVWQESSTMLSHEDWTGNRFAAWAGLDFSRTNMFLRPGPRTELPGLYLTGASTSSGGAILGTLRGGVETAGQILGRHLFDEVKAGAVFGHGLTDKDFSSTESPGVDVYRLRVSELVRHTSDCVVIEFEVPEDIREKFAFEAGQHVTLHGSAAGETVRRSYSICEPAGSNRLRIAVKLLPGGVFSSHALERLRVGDTLDLAPPRGTFTATPAQIPQASYVAVAAGSGITPILSILTTLLRDEPESTATLIYGNRTVESTMFDEDLRLLAERFDGRLRVEHYLSRESPPPGRHPGRIGPDAIGRLIGRETDLKSVHGWYLCGPVDMLDGISTSLAGSGVVADRIHVERFDTAGPGLQDLGISSTAIATVRMNSGRGEELVFAMRPAAETILEAAMRHRDDLPYSCMTGTCGTCIVTVLTGEVVMEDEADLALTADDAAAGKALACLAHPLTEQIHISFDDSRPDTILG